MIEKHKLKAQGLAFGRHLQRAYRIVLLYSSEHAAAQESIQQAFSSLTSILQHTPQFSLGFFNQRLVFNDFHIPDESLSILKAEFFKRDIATVTFSFGIAFRDFQKGMGVLTAKPEGIEQSGGITSFLRKNRVERMGILAGSMMTSVAITSLEMLTKAVGIQKTDGFGATASGALELATQAAQAVTSDLKVAMQGLAQLLENTSLDVLLSAVAASRESQLRGLPREEIATEMAEAMAVDRTAKSLASAVATTQGRAMEEEVIRILSRSVQTSPEPERFLGRLSRLVEQAQLPKEMIERIQQELLWSTLSADERFERLLAVEEFTETQFRHLIEFLEEMRREESVEKAARVSGRYMAWLETRPAEKRAEALGRLPELLRATSTPHSLDFVRKVAERLSKEVLEENADWKCHREVANSLASAAQSTALLDDFETALKVGLDLERSLARDSALHNECCGNAMANLLAPASVDRLVEMALQKHPDPRSARTVATLMRLMALQASEVVLRMLEEESSASARGRLVRLAGQFGSRAVVPARRRLADSRWYVVRNACNVLGAIDDPDLAAHLEPALRHSDVRVKQAAVAALTKNNLPGRGEALAKALPFLQPHLQETVLDELILAKDPATVPYVEEFIFQAGKTRPGLLEKAVQSLAGIPEEAAVLALSRILADTGHPVSLRSAALAGLKSSPVPSSGQYLADFVRFFPYDPLVQEYQAAPTRKSE